MYKFAYENFFKITRLQEGNERVEKRRYMKKVLKNFPFIIYK